MPLNVQFLPSQEMLGCPFGRPVVAGTGVGVLK